jgi:hypothetical protein
VKRALNYRTVGIATGILASVIVVLGACSNQGEGERCDFLNGDEDCKTDEDLVCTQQNLLTNSTSDRCCPRDRSTATHPVCKTSVDIGAGDSAAPADTGPPSTADANVDDAGTDATDGATDAPSDG